MTQEEIELGKKMVESGILTAAQWEQAEAACGQEAVSLAQYLVRHAVVAKAKVYEMLAEVYGVPYADLASLQITDEIIRLIPADLAYRFKLVPIFKIGNALNVAMQNPSEVAAIDQLAQKTGLEIEVCLGAADDIEAVIQEHYGAGNSMSRLLDSLQHERAHRVKPQAGAAAKPGILAPPQKSSVTYKTTGERPVIQLVDLMIRQAYEEGASDIHVEPEEKALRIRYRVDGVLHEASSPPKDLESEIISRIKILAQMDIAENRVAQDGRIKMKINDKEIDMRVSVVPTVYGENIVIRILRDESVVLDLTHLGFSEEMKKIFEGLIQRPYGMILETGPTGSGKTTTLYAALGLINSVQRNIITIEDPVEYKLPMLRQIPVNNKAGLTFANALRSILRQDPDVIMVGEIRDTETAEIAIQAALTGHLVFSTVHANSASGVVTRLVDMKIEPFLVASSVVCVISQRLVRRICEKCKEPVTPTEWQLQALKILRQPFLAYKGKGCRHCRQTGYKGRIGIFEMLKVTDAIQKKIMANASAAEIEDEARKSGHRGLREDALKKIEAGLTTIEEVIKAVDLG